ncbi:hypothetical protein P3X46_009243 [Hevea brasiliensis]|uniref:Uncharacterized protein n=2 Tax=Hevea brasiliensis TaxID=3981 RepID=A0A6A6KKQ6_HEVBR|nr:uncharacterized protein LOC110662731 [Hevea brasiliensis]XP_021677511.1 uncharacterized protein LOC110662731 [Hevea brasiliensis]KAF2289374.1 hypothetical protein GH714_035475 [Hevea brasiliensis]KAF2289377.1 hypothetical protein GH714_035509 [Hevea brasiliensis]KAJ9181074.1 hypothetical protein P3X46_009243 [Hevea brasiliensis]KAJ9181075.1 hypothetical protein P3X46_009243 [Hevea brasiliensis]
MAASETHKVGNRGDLAEILKPFYRRATEAEDRLSRLEVALASKKDAENEELLKTISELQSKLEGANAELASEQEKAKNLAMENAKLQYRILHLVRAVHDGDIKLENLTGGLEARSQTITKLEGLRL